MKQFIALLLLSLASLGLAQTSPLSEVLEKKHEFLNDLWSVSMNQKDVTELSGEISAENWDQIRPKSKSVKEVAALIVQDISGEIVLRNMNMGDKSSGALYFDIGPGETILGRFHTHPYEYASLSDMPFSPRDLVDLYMNNRDLQLKPNYFSLIRSGEKSFAFVITNPEVALTYYRTQEQLGKEQGKTLFDYLYKKFYSINRGSSIQDIQVNSLLLILGSSEASGIELLEISSRGIKKLN